jgi:Bacterial SH3 domain.
LVRGGFYSSDPFNRNVHASIRCNNPGAINGAQWEKNYPGYVTTVETMPGNLTTIFEAPEYGVAAWWELLRQYATRGVRTLGDIITRYGGGQDYSHYISCVTRWTGFGANTKIDLDDDDTLLEFGKAMFHYEAGEAIPWTEKQILYGLQLGRAGGIEGPKAKLKQPKPSGNKLFVTTDLHVRNTPSPQGEIKGVLKQGDVVQWLDSSDDDYWCKIKKGPLTGWSSHKYLVPLLRGGKEEPKAKRRQPKTKPKQPKTKRRQQKTKRKQR